MYASNNSNNISPAPGQDLDESTELDELMTQVWKRALQEDPQDQAKRGGDLAMEQANSLSPGGDAVLPGFVHPTVASTTTPPVLPHTPLDEQEAAVAAGRFGIPPFLPTNRSPLATGIHNASHSNINNNSGSNNNNNNSYPTGMYAMRPSQSSPLTTPMNGISVPLTGSYTQSHVVMSSGGAFGVEEEMLQFQQPQPFQPRGGAGVAGGALYPASMHSPVDGAAGEAVGFTSVAADLSPQNTWQRGTSHCTPDGQQQQQQQVLSPHAQIPMPASWAAAHKVPQPHALRCVTPPQRPSSSGSMMMPSIAAAAASLSQATAARDPSPSQRRLPPGGAPGQGSYSPNYSVMSGGGGAAMVARPQPRHAEAPTVAGCATPLQHPAATAATAGPHVLGAHSHHHTTPARPGSTQSCSPLTQAPPFFTTPQSTPSRPQMPRNISFTTSPLLAAELQNSARYAQAQASGSVFGAQTSGKSQQQQQSGGVGFSPGHQGMMGSASHNALLSTPPHGGYARMGGADYGSTTPQLHVSATKQPPPRGDTPPTPSVMPLLALLRGDANGFHGTPAEGGLSAQAFGPLPASPSRRPQGPSPGRDGQSPLSATGCVLASPQDPLPLKERVVRLSQDQVGCRMLQAIVDAEMTGSEPPAVLFTNSKAIQELLDALMPDIATIMSDSYGNFLIQKIFDVAPPQERKRLLRESTLSTQLAAVACSCHGTFAVQRLIETMVDEEEEALVKAALRRSTLQLLTNVNGGHVISKWLAYMRQHYSGLLTHLASSAAAQQAEAGRTGAPHAPLAKEVPDNNAAALARRLHDKTDFLFDGILDNLRTVCLNRQGCCVVQKTCDYWSAMSLPTPLSLPAMAEVGEARVNGSPLRCTPVHAVQAAVRASGSCDSLQAFVVALLDHVLEFAVDPYGNYVLTHAVKLCYVKGYLHLVDAIAGCLLQPDGASVAKCVDQVVRLCHNKFASNVVEQVLRLCGERRVRALCRLLLHTPTEAQLDQQQQGMVRGVLPSEPTHKTAGRQFLEPIAWNRAHADPRADGSLKSAAPRESLPLLDIALDTYGNYVIQTLLTVAPVGELVTTTAADDGGDVNSDGQRVGGGILPVLQEALPRLRDKNFGRKMETKIGLAQLRVSQPAN